MTIAYLVWTALLIALAAGAYRWQREAQQWAADAERWHQRAEALLTAAAKLKRRCRPGECARAEEDHDHLLWLKVAEPHGTVPMPSECEPCRRLAASGAIVNVGDDHWTAL